MVDIEKYIIYLKQANRDFGLNNDYLEGKKDYKDMNNIEKVDIDFINHFLMKEGKSHA